ncbi:MAG: hypothetical protein ACLQPD_36795 [Desulfomonilaceae bacterium]
MTRYAMLFCVLILFVIVLGPQTAMAQKTDPSIVDFKAQPLYRAAKLTWKTNDAVKEPLSVQILRAETFEEGPYKELEVMKLVPGKNAYEYVDKSMGTESKYHYKLAIKETGESFGPVSTRPYFSPPATRFQAPDQKRSLVALRWATR